MFNLLKTRFGILIIGAAIIALLLFGGFTQTTFYRPGWEIKSEIVAMDYKGRIFGPEVSPDTSDGQDWPWGPGTDRNVFDVYGSSMWRFDYDVEAYGLPDIEVMISDVRKKEGIWPYADLEQVFDEYLYVVSYTEYLFDVQIRTVADANQYQTTGGEGHCWQHETSCPYEYHKNFGSGGDKIGEPYEGCAYLRFVVHPWGLPDFTPAPENYTFQSYWAGVMNMKLEGREWGKVETSGDTVANENHAGYVRGLPSDGSQLNMYQDDGSFARAYSEVPWDINKVLDPDIKSSIVVQLPFEILAGAYEDFSWVGCSGLGAINHLFPVDYWVTATIRVETFIVKEYYGGRDPQGPVNPSPIQPPEDYFPVHIPGFWERYWLPILIIIGIIAIFIIGMIFLGGAGFWAFLFGFLRIKKLSWLPNLQLNKWRLKL